MMVTPTLTINGSNASVKVDVSSDEAFTGARLSVLLLHKDVYFNNPPGSNGETHFPFVARWNDIRSFNITANGSISETFS